MSSSRSRPVAYLQRLALIAALVVAAAGWHGSSSVSRADDNPIRIMGAGDIAGSLLDAGSTGDLIRAANPDFVFTTGDNAYPDGTPTNYAQRYDPSWGSFKDKTRPVPGNHEYHNVPPQGYVGYFGADRVTNPDYGGLYYAWNVGNGWRAYALNTEIPTTGAQLDWLRKDLAAHPGMHYILHTHHPRYTSGGNHSGSTGICPLWDAIAATGGLEIVLTGHQHDYERFARMDCAGNQMSTGARSFVIGSGGNGLYRFGTVQPGSEFRNDTDYGVLELALHSTYYEWSFIASGRGEDGSTSVVTGNAGQRLDTGSEPTAPVGSPGNSAPVVDAGVTASVVAPGPVSLDGTVTDDGLPNPPGAVTSTWSRVSGPGTVTFGNSAAVDTTASFSAAGTYVLQLSATDSAATGSDTVTVTVEPSGGGGGVQTVEVRVAAGSDDAEQRVGGTTTLTSTDLELIADGSYQQVVGVRFAGVRIPAGAKVARAWVQFQTDEVSTDASSMTIKVESSANPATYTSGTGTVTARPVTGSVAWAPAAWPTVGAAGADQRTPDIAGLVQAAVGQSGWVSGNAIALQFSGSGRRTAEAYEGTRTGAPLLHVEYTVG
ncbi:MAG: metallophosphoesterase [Actinomycetes bacterium]